MSDKEKPDTTTPRTYRLDSLEALRRFHGRILNEVRSGKLDAGLGSKLSYMTNVHAGLIRDSDVEARVAEIERTLKEERNG